MPDRTNLFVNTLPLLFICFTAVLGVYALGHFLKDAIVQNRHLPILKISAEVLPIAHDNDLPADRISVNMPTYFASEAATNVYRARLEAKPVGVVISPVRARGYNGIIELALGIEYDGTLAGVRILQHRETPELGDQIHQDNSSWIHGFSGRSLANTPRKGWAGKNDGGLFDHISGATSSQRAVIHAVEYTLDYYMTNRAPLFNSGHP